MSGLGRIVAMALVMAAVSPGAARAADGDYCVGVVREGCAEARTLAQALAQLDRARVFVGAGTYEAAVADDGRAVEIAGAGAQSTTLGAVELISSASRLTGAALSGRLRLAGRAERVEAHDGVELLPGGDGTLAQLAQAVVAGSVAVTGPAQLDSVHLQAEVNASAGLDVECSRVLARHLAVTVESAPAVRAGCEDPGGAAAVELRSSVLGGEDPVEVSGPATVTTAHSAHDADADVTDPTGRLERDAPLVDAGDPAPLAAFEPFEDAAGDTRVTDGDGDGVVRRDVGAFEVQPPPAPMPAGNILVNPGAELGEPGAGAPPGWSGTFATAAYGEPYLPGRRAAAALGAGGALFTAGTATTADLLQRIDLHAAARSIDAGAAFASLQGLLGGYGADADAVRVTAAFRDPEGTVLGQIVLGPVSPDERGRATNLLLRSGSAAIPPRTRAVDVTIHGERHDAGLPEGYTDAYADEMALALTVPGVPVDPPVKPDDPIVPGLRPFAGVTVLTARPAISGRWRAPVLLACPTATVGGCTGSLELRARLRRHEAPVRVARLATFILVPGRSRRIVLRILPSVRRALRRRTLVRARLLTVARDAQGVQRERTVALRLRLPEAARRRAARPQGSAPGTRKTSGAPAPRRAGRR